MQDRHECRRSALGNTQAHKGAHRTHGTGSPASSFPPHHPASRKKRGETGIASRVVQMGWPFGKWPPPRCEVSNPMWQHVPYAACLIRVGARNPPGRLASTLPGPGGPGPSLQTRVSIQARDPLASRNGWRGNYVRAIPPPPPIRSRHATCGREPARDPILPATPHATPCRSPAPLPKMRQHGRCWPSKDEPPPVATTATAAATDATSRS